jgi:hypothetical protein
VPGGELGRQRAARRPKATRSSAASPVVCSTYAGERGEPGPRVRVSSHQDAELELGERDAAFKDGRLHLAFDGGWSIEVPPGTDYEPWTLNGPDGLLLVSVPGGDLAIW